MKICICICGLNRSIDLVIHKLNEVFKEHDIEYIVSLSQSKEEEYLHISKSKIEDSKIIKKLYLQDYNLQSFRNSENYSNKILNSIKLIQDKYDLYLVMRSDLILGSINLNNIEKNKLYFSKSQLNPFSIQEKRINDNIIITKEYSLLLKLIDLHEYNQKHKNYLDINLYQYIEKEKIDHELINIEYKLLLSECNIIGITGDSGSGKTTLSKILNLLFKKDATILETDRYHKWERGDENYQHYTHLHPYANHLEKMSDDVYQLKIGENVFQIDYDHSNGKFTQKQKIENKKNIVLCGLHTLYQKNMNELLNLKIYLDTDRELIKKWKIQRDVNERGYNLDKVLKQIDSRENDYNEYIVKQKENADIIIHFYENNNEIQCNFVIQSNVYKNKIIEKIIVYKYDINYDINKNLIIKLRNNIDIIDENIILLIEKNKDLFKNNFFKEIISLIQVCF